jgi:transposase InsO family protein
VKTRRYSEAQAIVEAFRQEYNNYRPHSSLDYLTPMEFARRYYERSKEKQVMQPREKTGSCSF